jgi:predicted dehydrogenase
MKLALVAADPQTLAVARAALRAGHELAWYSVAPKFAATLRALAPAATAAAHWEEVLAGAAVDAVLLGRGDDADLTAEQFRRLVQAGLPLVTSHPLLDSSLVAAELEMVRRESGAIVVPTLAARRHAGLATLRNWAMAAGDSPVGPFEQVRLERHAPQRDRATILGLLAQDLDPLRALCGEPVRVTASAPREGAARYAGLSVALETEQGLLARWSYEPSGQQAARLVARGRAGLATLCMPVSQELDVPDLWRLELDTDEKTAFELAAWDAAGETVANLQEALGGQPPAPDWQDATRALELVEAVERSLNRGRSVELQQQDTGEAATFKGLMASAGCLLLLSAVAALVAALVANRLGVPWARWIVYGLIGVLGLFLVVQFLQLAIPRNKDQ